MPYFRPYKYVKDQSNNPIYKAPTNNSFVIRIVALPTVFTILGVFILVTQIIFPLVAFTTQDEIAKPVESSVLGLSTGWKEFEFSELKNLNGVQTDPNVPDYYYLTIPKLNIEGAKVETRPSDLDPKYALGHYIGSNMPGEIGNSFIYGHSVLPFFYNPKNYKTIFSTLSKLESGNKFSISYNNKTYEYVVENIRELRPEYVDPLKGFKPSYLNESTVTLMTCSPAGTKINRLMVDAVLVN